MPREVKHGRHAFLEEAAPPASGAPSASSAGGPSSGISQLTSSAPVLALSRRAIAARWFAALGPAGEPPPAPQRVTSWRDGRGVAIAGPLVLGALLAVAALASIRVVPLALAAAVVIGWCAKALQARLAARANDELPGESGSSPPRPPSDARGLELDGERLAFQGGSAPGRPPEASAPRPAGDALSTLLLLDAPFGVTLLASPRRDRVLALLSSASGTYYVGAAFDAPARRAFAPLLDRSFTIVGDDAGMDAIGPDGQPLVLAPDELASLLDALVEQSPTCLERFVLTDARGASLTLDGRHLCVGDRAVDLNAPLEWKSIVFQEAFGQVIAVYQGTWIRQSGTELTLVSLLPALGPALGSDLDLGSLDRRVLRDLRLMQASPEPPPPNEQRVAIDRLFMLQVRSALDRAPRASHQPDRAQA
jgi:hypothetical protein